MTTPEDVFRAGGRVIEPFDLNGTKVHLRSLALDDAGQFLEDGVITVKPMTIARILAKAIVDEDGARVFKDADAKRLVSELDAEAASAMFYRVLALSAVTTEEQDEEAASFGEAQDGEASTG